MDRPIPLNDLKRHYAAIKPQVDMAIHRVMESGCYIMGKEHDAFEDEFATYLNRRFVVAVANGTDALELGLRSLEIGAGNEVIMVANAGMYAAIATLHAEAIPVFADIDLNTLTISADSLAQAISSATRAVVLTHLNGKMVDIDSIHEVLKPYPHIKILEDCSQAHGAEWKGKKSGTFSDVAAFSLYPTKNLGAFGDAGVVVTDSQAVYARLRSLRNYGWSERYHVDVPMGRNSRLDELQAAILRVKLHQLDGWNARRRLIAKRYHEAAVHTSLTVVYDYSEDYVAHHCVARHPERSRIQEHFAKAGIATGIYYPITDDQQPVMQHCHFRCVDLTQTHQAQKEIFTLPCFPEMMETEIDHVCNIIRTL